MYTCHNYSSPSLSSPIYGRGNRGSGRFHSLCGQAVEPGDSVTSAASRPPNKDPYPLTSTEHLLLTTQGPLEGLTAPYPLTLPSGAVCIGLMRKEETQVQRGD